MVPTATAIETGLRGGAVALLLLLALTGWRDARRAPAARYLVLLDLCAIAFLVETAPGLAFENPAWLLPIRVLSMAAPAAFQLWVAAGFDDAFAPRRWRWLPFGGMAALAAAAVSTDSTVVWRAARIAALLLVAAAIWQVLAGRAADLVERRRRFRLALAFGAGVWIAALTLFNAAAGPAVRSAAGNISAGGVLALALAAGLARLRTAWPEPGRAAADSAPPVPAVATDADESLLLARLQALMETDRIYRDEGLAIGTLAARLRVPEYRLRRLINRHLGHRNFNSFVNGYRLAEAKAALADPEQRQVPVLTIALDAGFRSIGPFNRAFKATTGRTPSEFRRHRLARIETPAAERVG